MEDELEQRVNAALARAAEVTAEWAYLQNHMGRLDTPSAAIPSSSTLRPCPYTHPEYSGSSHSQAGAEATAIPAVEVVEGSSGPQRQDATVGPDSAQEDEEEEEELIEDSYPRAGATEVAGGGRGRGVMGGLPSSDRGVQCDSIEGQSSDSTEYRSADEATPYDEGGRSGVAVYSQVSDSESESEDDEQGMLHHLFTSLLRMHLGHTSREASSRSESPTESEVAHLGLTGLEEVQPQQEQEQDQQEQGEGSRQLQAEGVLESMAEEEEVRVLVPRTEEDMAGVQLETMRTAELLNERQSVVGELAMLQQEQCETVRELLRLRVEQLQLRIQQLSALSCLLDSERLLFLAAPTQLTAVQHVIDLLTTSLRELLREPSIAAQSSMRVDHAAAAAALSASMSAVDSRADQIANMARSLLQSLHSSPWRMTGLEAMRERYQRDGPPPPTEGVVTKGASQEQISSLPTFTYDECNATGDDRCPICLDVFKNGDVMRPLRCNHQHHRDCLDQWLSIRNCCSLCLEIAVKDAELPVDPDVSCSDTRSNNLN